MEPLTLKQASGIVDAALEKAREINCKPMTVAVLDVGGHLLSFKREDGSSIMRPQIARAKTSGALGMGIGGRALAARTESDPTFFAALTDISGGRIAPVPAGILIRDADPNVLGAVVSAEISRIRMRHAVFTETESRICRGRRLSSLGL
jgi:uncharacterized protein GlcG (DUF336 family)